MKNSRRKKKLATEVALRWRRFEYRPMFRVIVTMAFFGVTLLVLVVLPFEANSFFSPWFKQQVLGLTLFELLTSIGVLLGIYGVSELAGQVLHKRMTVRGALFYAAIILIVCSFLILCLKNGELSVSRIFK